MALGTLLTVPIMNFDIEAEPTSGSGTWSHLVMHYCNDYINQGGAAIKCPVKLELHFRMRRTKSMSKQKEIPHIKQPTTTQLADSIIDALSLHLLLKKTLIIDLHVTKRYSLGYEFPGCSVQLWSQNQKK